MERMHKLETLVEALEDAERRGFTRSFNVKEGRLVCEKTGQGLGPDDVTIVDHQRFEGPSSEDDNSVLYYVECKDGSRGTIVDAYGTYADGDLADFLRAARFDEGR